MQGFKVQPVELFLAAGKGIQMGLPLFGSVAFAVNAHGFKNGIPKLFHSFLFGAVGEDTLGPGGDGNRSDAPGETVGHLQAVKSFQCFALCLLGADEAYTITAAAIADAGWTTYATLTNPNM